MLKDMLLNYIKYYSLIDNWDNFSPNPVSQRSYSTSAPINAEPVNLELQTNKWLHFKVKA